MYLKFHNADHADVNLHEGMIVIGSQSDCHVMLNGKGVAGRHCRIDVHEDKVLLQPLDEQASCVLNGRKVHGDVALSPGDLLLLGQVGCQVALNRAGQHNTSRSDSGKGKAAASNAAFALCVAGPSTPPRCVVPCRGWCCAGFPGPCSDAAFPLRDGMLLGRGRDCEVFIESQEISRQHARLRVRPESVLVEDLNSTNGTFVNDERVTTALLEPGDELRLDTIRFVMVAPGTTGTPQPAAPAEDTASGGKAWRTTAGAGSAGPCGLGLVDLALNGTKRLLRTLWSGEQGMYAMTCRRRPAGTDLVTVPHARRSRMPVFGRAGIVH